MKAAKTLGKLLENPMKTLGKPYETLIFLLFFLFLKPKTQLHQRLLGVYEATHKALQEGQLEALADLAKGAQRKKTYMGFSFFFFKWFSFKYIYIYFV